MPKLTTTKAKRTLVITGLVASIMVAIVVFSVNSHGASAQSLTSSLKQKASSMLANKTGGNTTNSGSGGNSTSSSLKQKASGIIGNNAVVK
jgi:hypothetical protein